MTVRGVGFIGLRVADRGAYAATVALYRDRLGLVVTAEDGLRSTRFRLPDGTGLHVYGPEDTEHTEFGDRTCIGLVVDDIDAAWRDIEASGLEIVDVALERDGVDAWFHYRAPDGSIQELIGPDRG
jgi:catechol 2,3-dioxygenase-like lactoylglutathione lyase family enzyme